MTAIENNPYMVAVGQIWREEDPRFDRYVEVVGIDFDEGKVQLVRINRYGREGERRADRYTWAQLRRFHSRVGGYRRVK